MNAVTGLILAAGLGVRLRPSTDRLPKPLIPVGGIEPLFFALHNFYDLGIRRVVVNAHYMFDKIEAALKAWAPAFPGLECHCLVEKNEILGTGGAILNLLKTHPECFKTAGLLVQNGDSFAQIDIGRVFQDAATCSFAVSTWPEHLAKYHPLWINPAKQWRGIGKISPEAQAVPAHFLGVHYLSPTALKILSSSQFRVEAVDLFNGIYRPLADQGQSLKAVEFFGARQATPEEFWFDMTTSAYLLEAQHHVLDSLLKSPVWSNVLKRRYPNISEREPGVWVRAAQTDDVTFRSPAVLIDSIPEAPPGSRLGQLTLGPHASLIHESGRLQIAKALGDFSISNAVVFVERSHVEVLAKLIKDEIRIL